MSKIEDKIADIRRKAAQVVVKATAVTALMCGSGSAVSCADNNKSEDNKDKTEKVNDTIKTSVVVSTEYDPQYSITFQNGDKLAFEKGVHVSSGDMVEADDTVTYNTGQGRKILDVKPAKYKYEKDGR